MTRNELVVTIAGLIATFALPWPCVGEAENVDLRIATLSTPFDPQHGASALRPYGVLERVRTGPLAGSQPTR